MLKKSVHSLSSCTWLQENQHIKIHTTKQDNTSEMKRPRQLADGYGTELTVLHASGAAQSTCEMAAKCVHPEAYKLQKTNDSKKYA